MQLPRLVVFKDLHSGGLVSVLDGWNPKGGVVHAVFPSRRGLMPAVRKLLDFLAGSFRELDFDNLLEGYASRGDEDACFLYGTKR